MTHVPAGQPSETVASPHELIAAFDRAQRCVLTTHMDPDLDCIGSQLALGSVLRARGKHVCLWSPSPVPEQYSFMPGIEQITTRFPTDVSFDLAVALDTAGWDRVGETPPFTPGDFPALINIDHHESNERFGTVNWVDPSAAAVGEMLCELFQVWGVEFTREIALCLYASIVTDTGSFAFSNTTARTHRAAATLLDRGVEPFPMWRRLYGSFPLQRHQLLAQALATLGVWHEGRTAIMRVTQAMLIGAGAVMDDTEGFIQYPRTVRGADVAVMLREQPGGRSVRVSLRANVASVAANRIAARFNGGGHPKAAGCTIEGTLDQAEHAIVEAIGHEFEGARADA